MYNICCGYFVATIWTYGWNKKFYLNCRTFLPALFRICVILNIRRKKVNTRLSLIWPHTIIINAPFTIWVVVSFLIHCTRKAMPLFIFVICCSWLILIIFRGRKFCITHSVVTLVNVSVVEQQWILDYMLRAHIYWISSYVVLVAINWNSCNFILWLLQLVQENYTQD